MPATPRLAIIPTLLYRDPAGMIDWLLAAFGFARHAVHMAPDGTVAHAELTFGNGMIMLGSSHDDDWFGKLVRPPAELGGVGTQSLYVIVSDADAHHGRAAAAGATILQGRRSDSARLTLTSRDRRCRTSRRGPRRPGRCSDGRRTRAR
jgi:uncharacterized glyoxalase superfamily protein PhnB